MYDADIYNIIYEMSEYTDRVRLSMTCKWCRDTYSEIYNRELARMSRLYPDMGGKELHYLNELHRYERDTEVIIYIKNINGIKMILKYASTLGGSLIVVPQYIYLTIAHMALDYIGKDVFCDRNVFDIHPGKINICSRMHCHVNVPTIYYDYITSTIDYNAPRSIYVTLDGEIRHSGCRIITYNEPTSAPLFAYHVVTSVPDALDILDKECGGAQVYIYGTQSNPLLSDLTKSHRELSDMELPTSYGHIVFANANKFMKAKVIYYILQSQMNIMNNVGVINVIFICKPQHTYIYLGYIKLFTALYKLGEQLTHNKFNTQHIVCNITLSEKYNDIEYLLICYPEISIYSTKHLLKLWKEQPGAWSQKVFKQMIRLARYTR